MWLWIYALVKRWPQIPNALTLLGYGWGVVWRYMHITTWHNPRKYVYSDMQMYVDLGKRLARDGYVMRPGDVTHPPGTAEIIAYFYTRDGNLANLVYVQVGVAAVVPIVVGLLAWLVFDKWTARLAVLMSSFYFPFVDYGGYFLSEIYMIALVPAVVALYLWSLHKPSKLRAILGGFGAGLMLFLAMVMKLVALPALVGFALYHWLFAKGPSRWLRTMALLAMLAGAAPGTYWMSDRCTTANQGEFCLGSNKSGADFLLGHYGRIQGIKWVGPKGTGVVSFGSPSAYQHGYRNIPEVPFAITDNEKNRAEAWKWIKKKPTHAFILSCEHVIDTMGATLPWPSIATNYWVGAQGFHYLYILFLLFPTLFRFVDIWRKDGFIAMLRSTEMIIFAPVFGVLLAVFIATGEPRYRMPFDSLFMLVALQFYRSLKKPKKTKKRRKKVPAPVAASATES